MIWIREKLHDGRIDPRELAWAGNINPHMSGFELRPRRWPDGSVTFRDFGTRHAHMYLLIGVALIAGAVFLLSDYRPETDELLLYGCLGAIGIVALALLAKLLTFSTLHLGDGAYGVVYRRAGVPRFRERGSLEVLSVCERPITYSSRGGARVRIWTETGVVVHGRDFAMALASFKERADAAAFVAELPSQLKSRVREPGGTIFASADFTP